MKSITAITVLMTFADLDLKPQLVTLRNVYVDIVGMKKIIQQFWPQTIQIWWIYVKKNVTY